MTDCLVDVRAEGQLREMGVFNLFHFAQNVIGVKQIVNNLTSIGYWKFYFRSLVTSQSKKQS